MKLYKTVEKEASASQIIEKSKFITYVKPVSSKEEADAFIAEIRKKHKDATHTVPAMVIRCSCSGLPTMGSLRAHPGRLW